MFLRNYSTRCSAPPSRACRFGKRFGLYRVDFETQARVPKLSAAFYLDVVARNAIGM
ncbi:family 1 glycosylhydrolase [Bradyrhizobium japonicum]|nr:family 1 glycosylhydrolase [Bradyrhizobium japonicum]